MKNSDNLFWDGEQPRLKESERVKLEAFALPRKWPKEISTLHNKYEVIEILEAENRVADRRPVCVQVKNEKTLVEYTAKFQGRVKCSKMLDLNNERKFLASISKLQSKKESSFLSRLVDIGCDIDFRYLIVEDIGRDLKTLLQHYQSFEPPTVFLITYYSFQAIKELHNYDYFHMDLRPSSFSISPTFRLKIIEFYRVTSSKSNYKVSHHFRLDRFASRKFHKQGSIFDAFDDYENWLYIIMYITCESKLPWKNGKHGYLDSKESFFKCNDDYNWCGSSDALILIPFLMKRAKKLSKNYFQLMSCVSMKQLCLIGELR